jgi:hypothetical protein
VISWSGKHKKNPSLTMTGTLRFGENKSVYYTEALYNQAKLDYVTVAQCKVKEENAPSPEPSELMAYPLPIPSTITHIPDPPGWKRTALPAAPTVVMYVGNGGNIDAHKALFADYRTAGNKVELRGPCYSACTIITSYVAKENLCIAEGAFMAFHAARTSMSGMIAGGATIRMYEAYPVEIRGWIDRNGGVGNLPFDGYWTMYDRDLWAMGYPKCAP